MTPSIRKTVLETLWLEENRCLQLDYLLAVELYILFYFLPLPTIHMYCNRSYLRIMADDK